jgi:hypothetical protein
VRGVDRRPVDLDMRVGLWTLEVVHERLVCLPPDLAHERADVVVELERVGGSIEVRVSVPVETLREQIR